MQYSLIRKAFRQNKAEKKILETRNINLKWNHLHVQVKSSFVDFKF